MNHFLRKRHIYKDSRNIYNSHLHRQWETYLKTINSTQLAPVQYYKVLETVLRFNFMNDVKQ